GTAHLAFTDTMQGTVRARDKMYTITQLKDEKFIRRYADYYVLALKQDDFAKIAIGNVNFFILYVKPAPRVKAAPLFEKDALLIRTVIGSILLLAFLFISMSFFPKPKPVTIEMVPERYRTLIIKPKPKLKEVLKGKDDKHGGSKEGEG